MLERMVGSRATNGNLCSFYIRVSTVFVNTNNPLSLTGSNLKDSSYKPIWNMLRYGLTFAVEKHMNEHRPL